MATTATLRSRRSAAQLHALVGVEREIRSYDPNSRRKYLCEFSQAFRSYHSILDATQLQAQVNAADIVLIGDYHALPACQRFAAGLLEQRALAGDRPVVLGLETIFSRDQHILEEWWRREIDQEELRQRMRFDLDWGYDWAPFYELLVTAREHAEGVYGLDCMPREDLRKIGARDRHAADKIAEVRQGHPSAAILVLFGESHLAPGHLPRALREQLPQERLLTVLQNVDALYWHAAGEQREQVEAVRVAEDVLCVFNSTPLEKYESYRLYLDRWSRGGAEGPDLAPTLYNLIDGLLRFLNINRYSPHNTTQPKFLVDMLPEVYCPTSDALLRRLLSRKGITEEERETMLRRVDERGCAYLPQVNAFYVREFQMVYAAEETARFLHHACLGLPERSGNPVEEVRHPADPFYRHALEYALAYLGSRVLYPARPAVRDANIYESYSLTREDVEHNTWLAYSDFTKFADFLILHREFESRPQRYPEVPKLITEGMRFTGSAHDYLTQQLGYLLGSDLYDAYLEGRISRADLRRTFLTHLEPPGTARKAYLELAGRVRLGRKKTRPASD
jgi:hypothetical protein